MNSLIKILINTFLFTTFLAFTVSASSENEIKESDVKECKRLYSDKEYEKALPFCESAEMHFRTGVIYGKMKNCTLSTKYYELSDSDTSYLNLSIYYLYGNSGCSKNLDKARSYRDKSLKKGNKFINAIWGKYHYNKKENKKALDYYKKLLFSFKINRDLNFWS